MAEPEEIQATEELSRAEQAPAEAPPVVQAPEGANEPPPRHLGDLGYALLAMAWGVVVISVGMWVQSR